VTPLKDPEPLCGTCDRASILQRIDFRQRINLTESEKDKASGHIYGDRLRVVRGTTRADDAQGTPTQSHIPPSILVYEDYPTIGSDDMVPPAGADAGSQRLILTRTLPGYCHSVEHDGFIGSKFRPLLDKSCTTCGPEVNCVMQIDV